MSDFKSIDSCTTMESFRAARSYNDIVIVLSTIKGSTESITNRLHKKNSSVAKLLQDIHSLEEFSYSIQFAKTLNVISVEAKIEKFKTICTSIENMVNTAISQAYFIINELGVESEPPELSEIAAVVEDQLLKTVRKYTSIVIPHGDSFTHYFILANLPNDKDYIISEFIIALHYDVSADIWNTAISFPARMFFEADRVPVSKKTVMATIQKCLSSDTVGIAKVSIRQKQTINSIDNVSATYIADDHLCIELVPGISPADINAALTKLLPIVYVALNITDPRRDIIHRMGIAPNGNKVIRIALMDRNFYESGALRDLKRTLNLDTETYKTLLRIAGL